MNRGRGQARGRGPHIVGLLRGGLGGINRGNYQGPVNVPGAVIPAAGILPQGYQPQYGVRSLDYTNEIGQARAITAVRDELSKPDFSVNTRGCWISALKPNGDGYCQKALRYNSLLNFQGQKRKGGKEFLVNGTWVKPNPGWLLHRLAYLSYYGVEPVHDASHLCDVRNCFNPAHLWDEPHDDNEERKYCIGTILCPVHGEIIVDACQHTPRCIKEPPPAHLIVCCRTHREREEALEAAEEARLEAALASTVDSDLTTPRSIPQLTQESEAREGMIEEWHNLDPSQLQGSQWLELAAQDPEASENLEEPDNEVEERSPGSEDGADAEGRRVRPRRESLGSAVQAEESDSQELPGPLPNPQRNLHSSLDIPRAYTGPPLHIPGEVVGGNSSEREEPIEGSTGSHNPSDQRPELDSNVAGESSPSYDGKPERDS